MARMRTARVRAPACSVTSDITRWDSSIASGEERAAEASTRSSLLDQQVPLGHQDHPAADGDLADGAGLDLDLDDDLARAAHLVALLEQEFAGRAQAMPHQVGPERPGGATGGRILTEVLAEREAEHAGVGGGLGRFGFEREQVHRGVVPPGEE